MPPFLPRKRLRSISPADLTKVERGSATTPAGKSTEKTRAKPSRPQPRKNTLFDDIDAGPRVNKPRDKGKALLQELAAGEVEDDSKSSALSSLSSEEDFEDVLTGKRRANANEEDGDEGDDDDEIEFEDVQTHPTVTDSLAGPAPSTNLELTLVKDSRICLTNQLGTKKGPTKLERQTRIATHQMHVMSLMCHNAIRNSWLCDRELQKILLEALPANITKEVERWRQNSGIPPPSTRQDAHPDRQAKGGKKKAAKAAKSESATHRDWGIPAKRTSSAEIDMSHGDPVYRLLKALLAYWRQRFRIIAPGIRKLGYMSLHLLDDEIKSFGKSKDNVEQHGERFESRDQFRACARCMEGSRDVGAQLFTALLRALGLEARMVSALQPVGFGWNKNEEAPEKKTKKPPASDEGDDEDESQSSGEDVVVTEIRTKSSKEKSRPQKHQDSRRRSNRGQQSSPILLSDSDAPANSDDSGDTSVIDTTPGRFQRLPSKPFDKDLGFPHYWSEVLSPVTNTYTPVDAMVLGIVATNTELVQRFETRGQKAEKAKQVTAYIIGHASDGTAKDVTVRYLKNRMLPGRTKGNRIPVEKVPVYNSRGKVKRYEQYDWFKTVMSGYVRGTKLCPRTDADDHEEATDLLVVVPKKREVKEGEETLQSYKASAEFVLERHLKREEALLPTAKHVKMFAVKGKGEDVTEEKVFLRKDVVHCKSMETWHKEGREPKPGAIPRKRVPFRAATTNRKREIAEAEHATGEKALQGLFSRDQTDWIVPPPIENGVIPKNAYGNMDVYVSSMVPEGAVHLPYRGLLKICRKLGIDFAEAVTGFEFGKRMAIPVITGVVIAEEHEDMVMEQWHVDEAERVRKEDEKRTKVALGTWRKLLMGLRVLQRVQEQYGAEEGDMEQLPNVFTRKKPGPSPDDEDAFSGDQARAMHHEDEDLAGGFLPEGFTEEEQPAHASSAFFPVMEEHPGDLEGGGFLIEEDEEAAATKAGQAYATPQPLPTCRIPEPSSTRREAMEVSTQLTNSPAPNRKRGRPRSSVKGEIQAGAVPDMTVKKKRGRPAKGDKHRGTDTTPKMEVLSDVDFPDDGHIADSFAAYQATEQPEHTGRSSKRRRVTMPVSKPTATRKTPRRNAKRASDTGVRSKYFEGSSDVDDDEDD